MAAPAFDKNLEVAPPDISGAPTSNTEDQALTPLIRIPPIYPRRAAIKGIEGWVELEFTVLESGSVTDVKILKAKPKRIFNRAAINAISAWKFKPRITDGKPVKQRATQIITFQLSQ
jgi:protein TonB